MTTTTDAVAPSAVPLSVPLDFAIIGAQKSASTFLQYCLAAHPQIDIPRTESPHFEDPIYGDQSMRALIAQFAHTPPSHRSGIKRPNYLGLAEVPRRLARHSPNAKLVVVLRDPVARAISAYRHYVTSGRLRPAPIETGMRRLLNAEPDPQYPFAHEVLSWGRYGEHLDRYLRHFSMECILILLQADIADNSSHVYGQTCAFLGVDGDALPARINVRRNVGAQSARHLQFSRIRARARQAYLEDQAASRRPVARRLAWPYVAALTAVDGYVMPRIPGEHEQLGAQTIAALREYYREDILHTQDIVQRDLTTWS